MRSILLFAILLFLFNGISNSQSVSFDIAKFNPPAGWAKDDKGNLLSYTFTNKSKGTYCVLGIYKNIASSGDAVIAGSYAHGNDLLDDIFKPDWIVFFHSLDFKNFTKVSDFSLSKEIIGRWISGGSSGLSTYEFASNGRYSSGGAFSTSHSVSEYTVKETTTSFVGDGEYKINGNVLTLISTGTKSIRTPVIRIFYRKEYVDWHKYLGMLDTSSVDGTLYEIALISEVK